MTENIKELVKRLRDQKFQYSGPQPDVMNEVADALEALAGEVERLRVERDDARTKRDRIRDQEYAGVMEELTAERDRLKKDVAWAAEEARKGWVNAVGWMTLSDALKKLIWKHPDAAKEMMAADLPPLPAPDDAVKLVAERDRLKAALQRIASQKLFAELEAGTEDDDVDYDLIGAWDIVIGVARKALGDAA